MKMNRRAYGLVSAAIFSVVLLTGCGNDNRAPSTQEIKSATDNRLKYINSMNIPEETKKEIASRDGGPDYTPPGQAKAMEEMAKRQQKMPKGARPF